MIDALAALVAPLGRLTDAQLLTGGQFATTYRVTLDDDTRVVVKTAPVATDGLLTYEHDLLRAEALVYGLAADRPALRMPQVLLTDFSRTVLPGDALVVSHLPGVPLVDAGFGPSSDPRTARAERGTGEVLAALHTLTGPAYGYPCGRREESWAASFTGMVDELLDDAARWAVPVPDAEVRAALARHASVLADVTGPALVHTDLWAGNLFVDPETGELLGVIDPERAVWGDPLMDLVGIDPMGRDPGTTARARRVRAARRRQPVRPDAPRPVPDAAVPGDDHRDRAATVRGRLGGAAPRRRHGQPAPSARGAGLTGPDRRVRARDGARRSPRTSAAPGPAPTGAPRTGSRRPPRPSPRRSTTPHRRAAPRPGAAHPRRRR